MNAAPRLPTIEKDPARVILLYFSGDRGGARASIARVLEMSDATAEACLKNDVLCDEHRHHEYRVTLRRHCEKALNDYLGGSDTFDVQAAFDSLSDTRKLLIGALFSKEYAPEGAALFNASMVPLPGPADAQGGIRCLMSLRATGEGHVSSLEFRECTIHDGVFAFDTPKKPLVMPTITHGENGAYTATFPADSAPGQRILFPTVPKEAHGIEDARFTPFREEDGSVVYYATYVGYDGRDVTPMLMKTTDFLTFENCPLTGDAIRNKGFALFPRMIGGEYWMLGRQDNQNIRIMHSKDPCHWDTSDVLVQLQFDGEMRLIGNCGSPIELEGPITVEGKTFEKGAWLILDHRVGFKRRYTIGATLVDIDDPTIVLARTPEPLFSPHPHTREGHVTDVVYSCGAFREGDRVHIPVAESDERITVYTETVQGILAHMSLVPGKRPAKQLTDDDIKGLFEQLRQPARIQSIAA